MGSLITKHCDECDIVKGETNHWLVAISRPGLEGIIFQPAESVEDPRRPDFLYEDICGQGCANKRLSRYLNELKIKFSQMTPSEAE